MFTNDYIQNEFIYVNHNISENIYDDFELHCHGFYELFFLFSGNVDYRIEGQEYQLAVGSMLMIAPNIFHGVKVKSKQPYHRLSVHFREELIPPDLRSLLLKGFHSKNIYYSGIPSKDITPYVQTIVNCISLDEKIKHTALSHAALSLLFQVSHLGSLSYAKCGSGDTRVHEIINYINENLTSNLTLSQIADRFFISKNHLNVLFKNSIGTTVSNYIKIKRITCAHQKILEGCKTKVAAFECGYSDYSNFYRSYVEHFGYSPAMTGVVPIGQKNNPPF